MLLKRDDIKIILFISCAVILVFSASLSFDFSFIDDPVYVYMNPLVTGFKITDIFKESYFAAYIPMTILSYAVEYIFWGKNPFGYHLTNLVLHLFNVIFLYLIILRLTKDRLTSLFSAMVFAIHPLQIQTVVWISERKSILSLFFMLLSFWYYIDFKEEKSKRPYVLSLLFFLLSILSKPISVTFFLLLICYDNFILKERIKSTVTNKIPFIALSIPAALITFRAQNVMGAVKNYYGGSFYTNLITIPKGLVHYFKSILFPKGLLLYYDLKPAESIFSIMPLIGIAIIVFLIFIMIRARQSKGIISFGIAMFFIFLLPVSNIIPLENIVADRYMYIPIAGLSLSLISFLKDYISRFSELFYALLFFTFVLLSSLTISQSFSWDNKAGIWEDILEHSPENTRALNNLIEIYMVQGRKNDAEILIKKGMKMHKDNPGLLKNFALYLRDKGESVKALGFLKKALKIDPNDKEIYLELAKIDYEREEYESALSFLKEGMKIAYEFPLDTELKYRFTLANIYVKKIMFDEAIVEFKQILVKSDNFGDAKIRHDILVRYVDDFKKYRELYIKSGKSEYKKKLAAIFSALNLAKEGERYLNNFKNK